MSDFQAQVLHVLVGIHKTLDRIETLLALQGIIMSKELDDLTAEVADISTASDSVIALVKGLADQIAADAGDKAKMVSLAAALKVKADSLAAAVVNTTPPVPVVPPAPPVPPNPQP
jgi:predicted component of type VI protein secretion system